MRAYLSPIVLFLAVALVIAVVVSQTNNRDVVPPTEKTAGDMVIGGEAIALQEAVEAAQEAQAPAAEEAAAVADVSPVEAETNTVLGSLRASNEHNTLVKAAEAAGVAQDWAATSGEATLFAPVDAAFARLPAGAVDNLMKPENKEALQALLKRHVVNERVLLSDIEARATNGRLALKSAADTDIVLSRQENGLWVIEAPNGEKGMIMQPNVNKLNGIIQSIDQVLYDPATLVVPAAADTAAQDPAEGGTAVDGAPAEEAPEAVQTPADEEQPVVEDEVTAPETP